MRNLEELYTAVLAHFVANESSDFICTAMYEMGKHKLLTVDEFLLVYRNFKKNRPTPTLHPAFCDHELYSRTCWNWFGNGKVGQRARTNFLKYLILNHIP